MARFRKSSDIKVGVIGYGGAFNMGFKHLKEAEAAGMKPTAVCDTDRKRLEVAAKDIPGIETYTTVEEMLKKSEVNFVIIITPHNTHAKLAIQCLNAGRHVVCEKPLAITTDECDAMIAAAKKKKVLLSTYHNRHWDGIILQAMEYVRGGQLGSIVRVDTEMGGWNRPGDWWRSSKSISGGLLYDWGVHLLEYTLQIVNSDIQEVSGYLWSGIWAPQSPWKNDTIEDEGQIMVRYSSGAWSTLRMTSIESAPAKYFLRITGAKGQYFSDFRTGELITHDGATTVTLRKPLPKDEHAKFYQNIADHLVKDEPLIITPEWSRRPIHIIDLACRSASKKNAIKATYA